MSQLVDMQRGKLNTAKTGLTVKAFEEDFTFDATGNWTNFKQDTDGNGTWDLNQTRTHNAANEIATISGSATNLATDRNGNMTKMPKPDDWSTAFAAVYDAWNRMVQVKNGNSTVATYGYNALNHRVVRKTYENGSLSETRLFYFNQNWQCLEERVGTSTTADITYTWGLRYIDDLICRDRKINATQTERLYGLADANWNVVALTDSNGNAQERYNYSAFGKANVTSGTYVLRPTSAYGWTGIFTGQILDAESGLMLYRNRFYHAELGRFITRDPIGYEANDVNVYRYALNKPKTKVDPAGLIKCPGGTWSFSGITAGGEIIIGYYASSVTFKCRTGIAHKMEKYTCCNGSDTLVIEKNIISIPCANGNMYSPSLGAGIGGSIKGNFGGRVFGKNDSSQMKGWGYPYFSTSLDLAVVGVGFDAGPGFGGGQAGVGPGLGASLAAQISYTTIWETFYETKTEKITAGDKLRAKPYGGFDNCTKTIVSINPPREIDLW